jgi:hypothetical protein
MISWLNCSTRVAFYFGKQLASFKRIPQNAQKTQKLTEIFSQTNNDRGFGQLIV